jgi:hypothetical protein
MGRTAVLLIHHLSQQPDLFTAQEAEHQSFRDSVLASPILTAGTRSEAVLSEENLRDTRTTEASSKVYY